MQNKREFAQCFCAVNFNFIIHLKKLPENRSVPFLLHSSEFRVLLSHEFHKPDRVCNDKICSTMFCAPEFR